jgi:hypothetical protein
MHSLVKAPKSLPLNRLQNHRLDTNVYVLDLSTRSVFVFNHLLDAILDT